MFSKPVLLGVGVVALVLASFSLFTVKEYEHAVLFRLGEIVATDYEPGLHFKLPLVNNVRKFDARVLTLDVDPERFLTAEKKNLIVDSFVKWRISDPAKFYTSVQGDERQGSIRLEQIIKDGLRGEFGKRTINEVVSGERSQIMGIVTSNANAQAMELGMEVTDVRLKRVDMPEQVSADIYRRMEAERARDAKDFRSRGQEAAERIRADADRQREVILAEAYRDAQTLRGQGDARAAEIYANAYQGDAEFYNFYRSLQAYRETFTSRSDLLVLEPDSEFFDYFGSEKGRQ